MFKPLLTRELAKKLAGLDKNYYARCPSGRWCVWDAVSDHEVEFDTPTLIAAAAGLSLEQAYPLGYRSGDTEA